MTGINYIEDALNQASNWSGSGNYEVEGLSRFQVTVSALIKTAGSVKIWWPFLALVLAAAVIVMKKNRQMVLKGVILALCACLPLLWFTVLSSHSYIHTHFALRNLAISVMAVTAFFAVSIESRTESAGRKVE